MSLRHITPKYHTYNANIHFIRTSPTDVELIRFTWSTLNIGKTVYISNLLYHIIERLGKSQ